MEKEPARVGVPLMAPEEAVKDRPAGRSRAANPEGAPPAVEALMVYENELPTVAEAVRGEVMIRGPDTVP